MNRLTMSALVAALMMGSVSLAVAQSGGSGGGSGGAGAGGSDRSGSDSRDTSPSAQDRGTGVINPGGSQGTTGSMQQQGRLSESEVQSMLQQRGYSQVGEIETQGGMYETRAMRNGQSVNVRVDPATGTITER